MTREKAEALVRDLTRDGYAARVEEDYNPTVNDPFVVVTGCGWPLTQAEKLGPEPEPVDFDVARAAVKSLPCG